MYSKIVLCASPKQATVGLWRWGRLTSCNLYPNTSAGHDDFRQFLLHHTNIPVYVIADAVEEDFRLETLPHAVGNARQEMVERKLAQLYRNSTYRTAQFAGREVDKRRDDRFLFMALTNPDIIAPWITLLEEIQAPLAGVYLLPMVSQLLVRKLGLKHPDLLLMTRHHAGLRQTYFSGQHLRLSRLTPMSGMDERQLNELYASETEKTRLYLISLRMIGRDNRLHLVFPTLDKVGTDLAHKLESSQGVSCEILGPEVLAHRLGLRQDLLQRYPELLHMQMLARQTPSGNLAPTKQTHSYRLLLLRHGINLASTLCVTVAILLAASNLVQTSALAQQLRTTADQTRRQEALYEEVAHNFPKTPLPGNDLKLAVELAQKIEDIKRTPLRLMQVTSRALDAQREIRLDRLRWVYSEDANVQDEGTPKTTDIALPPPQGRPQSGLYEIGFIDGEIENFRGDYRAALESVNSLVEKLRQDPQVEQAVILQQPVNTSSLAKLQGTTLDQQAQQLPAAHFKLRLILKPEASK
jgi:hypothetical protein